MDHCRDLFSRAQNYGESLVSGIRPDWLHCGAEPAQIIDFRLQVFGRRRTIATIIGHSRKADY